MFDFAFTSHNAALEDAAGDRPAGLRQRYESWRFRRDVAAIMATLDRLSDRRLEMIGMRRGELFEAVSDLILRAEEEKAIGREVIRLLEAPKPVHPLVTDEKELAETRPLATGEKDLEEARGLSAAA